jgi:hypothetical protein
MQRVHFLKIESELCHCELGFQVMFLCLETLNKLSSDFSFLIYLRFNLELVSLVQLLILLIIKYILKVFLNLGKSNIIEDV